MTQKRKLNVWSAHITEPKSQGASQAMLLGTGLSQADLAKPQGTSQDAKQIVAHFPGKREFAIGQDQIFSLARRQAKVFRILNCAFRAGR